MAAKRTPEKVGPGVAQPTTQPAGPAAATPALPVASRARRRAPLGGRRRGGAWKVAYADFVTALMALFIVLWMMNTSAAVRQSVSGYFKDPRGYTRTLGAGSGHGGEGLKVDRQNVKDVQKQIERALERAPEFKTLRKNIAFSATGEGLRIDLLETEQGLFFVTGQPAPTPAGERLLGMLAAEIGTMPNNVAVEGHTDALPFRGADPNRYGNWELSSDRAQAARRLLLARGLRLDQVVEVRGFADRKLLNQNAPADPRNRRVSLVVKFTGM